MIKTGLSSLFLNQSLIRNITVSTSFNQLNVIRNVSSSVKITSKSSSDSQTDSIERNHSCNVATIGHHQHGKTTLTDALRELSSKKFSFQLQPSLNRNETNASLSEYYGKEHRILHTDCPGDLGLIKNMITNAYSTDIGILVVDAEEGVMPQTREHLLIMHHFGVKDFIVYINKKGKEVDEQTVELVEMDIREYFEKKKIHLDKDSVIVGSCSAALEKKDDQEAEVVYRLLDLIEKKSLGNDRNKKNVEKAAVFSVKKVYTKANRGTEVTGILESGRLKKGDTIELIGYDKSFKTSILEIECFRKSMNEISCGVSAALLLKGVKKDDIQRGMAIYSNTSSSTNLPLQLADHAQASLILLDKDDNPRAKSLSTANSNLVMFGRTFDIRTLVRFDPNANIEPGQEFTAELKLLKQMALNVGLQFVLRDGVQTVALGTITKLLSTLSVKERDFNQKMGKR